jgi:exonuclease III
LSPFAGRGGGRVRLKGKQNPWVAIDLKLQACDMKRIPSPADGNCQFHSIAAHCDFSHLELRSAVVQFLTEHSDDYLSFFSEGESLSSYIEQLAINGTWGDNLSLLICAELLQAQIMIAQAHGVQVVSPAHSINPPIWVAYNGSTHYDAVFAIAPSAEEASQASPEAVISSPSQAESLTFCSSSQRHERSPLENSPTWTVMTANVTSFHAQQDLLVSLPFDVIALQETRHTAKSQHGFSLLLKKHGYQAVWGKPQPFKFAKSAMHTSTGLNGRPGGVAIVARSHFPMQFVPPGDCPIRKRLYHSCRWVHAVLAYGNCKQTLHVFSLYGFTGHYSHSKVADLNEALLQDVLEVITQLGPDAPVLVLGDINVEPDASPVLSHAIAKGILVDLGFNTGPTFFPTNGKARRLDVALATDAAASALISIRALPDSGFPGHLPLALNLDLPAFSEIVPRIRKPACLPESIPEQIELAESIVNKSTFPELLDSNSLYHYFSNVAEEFLIEASGLHSKRYVGRGRVPHVVKEPRFSPQGPAGAGCENVALRRLKRLLRRLEQLQHYFNNSMASSFQTWKLWQSVLSSRPFLLKFSNLFDAVDLPSAPLLKSMVEQVRKAVASMQAQETYKRITIAREKLQQDWKTKPSNVYSKVDPVLHAPTKILQTSEGKLTGNFKELESLFKECLVAYF